MAVESLPKITLSEDDINRASLRGKTPSQLTIPELRLLLSVDLQGCLPENHSYACLLYYNHRKVYNIVKLIKCKIRKKSISFKIRFNGKRAQGFKKACLVPLDFASFLKESHLFNSGIVSGLGVLGEFSATVQLRFK